MSTNLQWNVVERKSKLAPGIKRRCITVEVSSDSQFTNVRVLISKELAGGALKMP